MLQPKTLWAMLFYLTTEWVEHSTTDFTLKQTKTINITSKVNIWTVYCWRRDEQKQERLFFETPGKLRPVLTKHNETAIMLLQPLGLYLQAWKHFAAMQIENRGFKFYDVAPKTKLGKRYWLLLSQNHPIKLFFMKSRF